jgi:hypothetical protein
MRTVFGSQQGSASKLRAPWKPNPRSAEPLLKSSLWRVPQRSNKGDSAVPTGVCPRQPEAEA